MDLCPCTGKLYSNHISRNWKLAYTTRASLFLLLTFSLLTFILEEHSYLSSLFYIEPKHPAGIVSPFTPNHSSVLLPPPIHRSRLRMKTSAHFSCLLSRIRASIDPSSFRSASLIMLLNHNLCCLQHLIACRLPFSLFLLCVIINPRTFTAGYRHERSAPIKPPLNVPTERTTATNKFWSSKSTARKGTTAASYSVREDSEGRDFYLTSSRTVSSVPLQSRTYIGKEAQSTKAARPA